jgi:hypothetical protein
MRKIVYYLASAVILMLSCNKDDVVTQEVGSQPPVIELDSETGIYITKIGKEVKINPTYSNIDFAVYSWKYNGRIISEEPSLVYTFERPDSYYVIIRVDTPNGSSEEEIRIDVAELAPPKISLAIPSNGLKVRAGREYKLTPDIQNKEGATFRWTINGKQVGTDAEYTFCQQEVGNYNCSIYAENEDGNETKEFVISVVDKLPIEVTFVAPSFYTKELIKYVELGRTLYLRPYVNAGSESYTCQWSVNGNVVTGANSVLYAFAPESEGDYTLTLTVSCENDQATRSLSRNVVATGNDKVSVDIAVKCLAVDNAKKRPYSAGCSLLSNKVYEFIPAPGQFVNETPKAGYNGESTQDEAIAYAEKRLAKKVYVSLGGWGGYIIAGFDHSIENKGGYDFSIMGNQFDNSNEPGIVFVMQDVNDNGLPDEEWYELKGSEYGKPETNQFYAVTYYRPSTKGFDTKWTDNMGESGCVDYLGSYHPQPFYYPEWITTDTYTLYGPKLASRTVYAGPGNWQNLAFDGGYADNVGNDMIDRNNPNADAVKNYFKIADAVNLDGSNANLSHIDFIKVQTGVNVKAGWLGENSTEVFGFTDENNNK